tara:strand:- start:124 stop:390 length:267 start_codon:yes stop_codon:yes gene_type:complete
MIEAKTQYGTEVKIISWYMLRNGWEYFQLEEFDDNGHAYGYVMGDVGEFGSFNIHEIKNFLWVEAHGDDLNDVALPKDWERIGTKELI